MTNTILIIDDDFHLREGLSEIFASNGAIVLTAANGQEGIEILQQERQNISLVLLDMNMPVMNGQQTYEKLQEIAPEVKVIVSTSLSQAEVNSSLGLLKQPIYMKKPIDIHMLLDMVQPELIQDELLYPDPNNIYL